MNCPACGNAMEDGDLKAYGKRGGVSLYWKKEGESIWRSGENIDWGIFGVDLPASRCQQCKIVVFKYGFGEEVVEQEPSPNSFPFEE